MFAAALGACFLEFVANSCRLRSIPFERLSVELEYEELEWQTHPTAEGVEIKVLVSQAVQGTDVTCMLVRVGRGEDLLIYDVFWPALL